MSDIEIKDFGLQTTEEWAKFVMNNRNRAFTDEVNTLCNKDHKYDIVIGPVADDIRKRGLGFCERRMISMSKQDQIIEYIIQDIVDMLATDQNIEYDEAMNKFYNSEVFEKLQDKETGLYSESSEYIYDLFKDEMNFGHIIQAEI